MKIRCRAMRRGRERGTLESVANITTGHCVRNNNESQHEQIHPNERDRNHYPTLPGDQPKASRSQGCRSSGQHPGTSVDLHGCQPDPGRQSTGQRARSGPGQLGRLPAQGRGQVAAQGRRSSGWLPQGAARHRRRQLQHCARPEGQALCRSGLAIQRLPARPAAKLPGRPK
ncbi:hypothetical protein D3C77_117310 [compost metagenome]